MWDTCQLFKKRINSTPRGAWTPTYIEAGVSDEDTFFKVPFSSTVLCCWRTEPLTFKPLRKINKSVRYSFLEHSLFGKLFDFVLISLVMNLYFLNANPSILHEPFNLLSRKLGLLFQLGLQCFHLDRPKGVRYPLLSCFHLFLTSKSESFSRKL